MPIEIKQSTTKPWWECSGHFVNPATGASEFSIFAIWFGWLDQYNCYAYQDKIGIYWKLI